MHLLVALLIFAFVMVVGTLLIRAVVDLIPFPSASLKQAILLLAVAILFILALGPTGVLGALGGAPWR
jgi:hypothetical protein